MAKTNCLQRLTPKIFGNTDTEAHACKGIQLSKEVNLVEVEKASSH